MTWLLGSHKGELLDAREPLLQSASTLRSAALRTFTANGQTTIPIVGILTAGPDPIAAIVGGGNTTYPDVIDALAEAEADPGVARVRLAIDSPGGEVAGLFETIGALQSMDTPITVTASRAESAAYALAAVAGPITATTPASFFGSIGIARSVRVLDNVVDITNTESPRKRPDARTADGRAVMRAHLDELFGLFAQAIASGRGVPVQTVIDSFGKGATVLAQSAIELGMIDDIAGTMPLSRDETAMQTAQRWLGKPATPAVRHGVAAPSWSLPGKPKPERKPEPVDAGPHIYPEDT